MTRRATLRGAERTPLDERADVLVCGASFAGLAVARELAGSGADVLVVDRYEIGERATSACAAPTPWLHAMGVERSIRQELPCMAFHTPHGSARFRLPWSWSSFDYRELCAALWEQADARFEIAKVGGRDGDTVHTDRGDAHRAADRRRARLAARARRRRERAAARGAISRGLEVHRRTTAAAPTSTSGSTARWSATATRGRCRPAASGGSASAPTSRATTSRSRREEMARRLDAEPVRYQGNWFPHAAAPGGRGRRVLRRRLGRPLHPAVRRGDPHRVPLRHRLRARAARVLAGESAASRRSPRYAAFSDAHAPFFRRALGLQRLIPALPPRALTALLAVMGRGPASVHGRAGPSRPGSP